MALYYKMRSDKNNILTIAVLLNFFRKIKQNYSFTSRVFLCLWCKVFFIYVSKHCALATQHNNCFIMLRLLFG